MITVIDKLLSSLTDDAPVQRVLVGLHWTIVCSRHCGMAATLVSDHSHGDAELTDIGHLEQKSARELAEWARSSNLLQASIGVAAVNSLLEVDENRAVQINAADLLAAQGRGKDVALVGHFPFVPQLRAVVRQLWVLEQHPTGDDYPAEAASELVPRADIVAITSSTLVNHTLDPLLALCRSDAMVMLLGPTTPLSPVLFNCGVDILSGTRVVDESAVLRTVSQGASFRQVQGAKLLTLERRKERQ